MHNERALQRLGVEDDAAEDRRIRDLLHIVFVADASVQHFTQHGDAHAKGKTQKRTEGNVEGRVRAHRHGRYGGFLRARQLDRRDRIGRRRSLDVLNDHRQALRYCVGGIGSTNRIGVSHHDVNDRRVERR